MTTDFKEIYWAEHKYINIKPLTINALVMSLGTSKKISMIMMREIMCRAKTSGGTDKWMDIENHCEVVYTLVHGN